MPLLGNHHNNNTTNAADYGSNQPGYAGNAADPNAGYGTNNTLTGHGTHHNAAVNDPNYSTTGTGHHNHHPGATGVAAGAALGAGAEAHHAHNRHEGNLAAQQDPANMGAHHNPLYSSPNAPGGNTTTVGGAGATGTNATNTTGGASGPVKTASGHSAGTQAMIGKVEHAAGVILSSQTLKAKGLAKEEEAAAVKAQNQELANAQQMENSANLARDRAAVHGAHGTAHAHARENINAGGNYGAGPTNASDVGAGYGVGGVGGAGPGVRPL
ncbi:hypothetical protein SISNIDRAFT_481019 [Sistotremastrum niveocremeum HHB9708]|uniref:Uncharacterized protein n=1 Tax=Sistotremastrum niveocremeum HHB9708 TaxID=1314777 RepID=A0A164ZZ04_9AGAM|nr:hypothetical protein SISNIDRAFT_481019 [Sistotremastrum niveocremeum HHB9708]